MKKLRLQLDDLLVDSFQTTAAKKEKGTIFGQECTCYTNCTCPGCPTCAASCNGTCNGSCNGTCYSCDYTCDESCAECGTFLSCEETGVANGTCCFQAC